MTLNFLIADLDPAHTDCFRNEVRHLSSLKDFTGHTFAVKSPDGWNDISPSMLQAINIAWICGDYPGALELGLAIYDANPFCRITYYNQGEGIPSPLLASRPVQYLDTRQMPHTFAPGSLDAFTASCLLDDYDWVLEQKQYFHYEDRYQRLAIPYSAIRYFTSRDRMVYCQTGMDESGPIRRTLDQVGEMLDETYFLRCHKSFLVRTNACLYLDKSSRELVLLNGQRIPVSRAYWNKVSEYFDQNVASGSQNHSFADSCNEMC